MATFDKVIDPTSVTPAVTTDTALYTGVSDSALLVTATNIGVVETVLVRIGVDPTGAPVQYWKVYDLPLPAGESYTTPPIFIRVSDVIVVATNDADEVTFSVEGVRST